MNVMLPKVKIISNDSEKVAQLLCFNAKSIINGNYQKAGIPILPKNLHPRAVYFPNLHLSADFWSRISKFPNMNLINTYPIQCVDEILSKIDTNPKNYDAIIKDLLLKTSKFFQVINDTKLFQNAVRKASEVEILISPYGSGGSFFCKKKKDKTWKIYIAFKAGNPTDMIASVLLLALYRITYPIVGETGNFEYFVRVKTCNVILNQSLLANNFSDCLNLSAFPNNLFSNSQRYLKKLKVESRSSIEINNGYVYISGKDTTNYFTDQEIRVLSKLHSSSGKTVGYETLAKILWGKDFLDKYSLYSISKVIEKLRKKLVHVGINRKLIFTKSKRGYYFQAQS